MDVAQRILDGASYNMVNNLKYYNSRGRILNQLSKV